jgi:hypothetical protein
VLPGRHALPWQQPAQVTGPQAGCWQTPAEQLSLAPQLWHASPSWPHAALVFPGRHALPWQQPTQLAGVQAGWQLFWTQASLALHVLHTPPRPQAAAALPGTQALPWQHPLQFEAEHRVALAQLPFAQFLSGSHLTHDRPPDPHASLFVPGRQAVLAQHPSEQLAGSQAALGGMHRPKRQSSVLWHWRQAAPPVPHWLPVVPAMHTLPVQQPWHVELLQVSGSEQDSARPASNMTTTRRKTSMRWLPCVLKNGQAIVREGRGGHNLRSGPDTSAADTSAADTSQWHLRSGMAGPRRGSRTTP